MQADASADIEYKDQRPWLMVIGVLLLSVGVFAAFLGPIEMYCFTLFSEGGRFHYEGFGFGSFMFGNIASQIMGYYLVATLFIPLGYGHLAMRRWARTFALVSLWFWIVFGVPLTLILLFTLFSAKELSTGAAWAIAGLLGLSYFVLPGLLIRYYGGRNVRLTLEARDANAYRIERVPLPVLVLCFLFLFYIVCLHALLFFNGIYPGFGVLLHDLEGMLMIDLSILGLACLTWGMFRWRRWAWWGSMVYFGLLTLSSLVTLARSSLSDILLVMRLAPTEMEILRGIPLHGRHLAALVGVPLLVTWGLILFSRRYFAQGWLPGLWGPERSTLVGAERYRGHAGTGD